MDILTNIFYVILFIICIFLIGLIWELGFGAIFEIIKRIFGVKPKTLAEKKSKYPITSDLEEFIEKKLTEFKEFMRNLNKSKGGLNTTAMISSLKELEELRIKGVISQAEFEKLKADILNT